MPERMLTVRQVAERFQCSEYTIRRWIKERKLSARKIGGNRLGLRIPESEVERLIDGDSQLHD